MNQFKIGQRDLNRAFPKEDIQMSDKAVKRDSTRLVIRKMQIETTVRSTTYLSGQLSQKEAGENSKYWRGRCKIRT